MKKRFLVILGVAVFSVASAQKNNSIRKLKLIGEYDVPHNLSFNGTTVGGLSSIDYDKKSGSYYMISDDRSSINAARYYTAKIFFDQNKIDSVVFVNVTTLLQQDGKPYPNSKQDPAHTPDPEAMRYDPVHKQMAWSSEGERIVREKDTVLENPSITIMSINGKYIDTFSLPKNLRMHATENGPRQNGVLEGMSFADDFKTLYVNVEEPLYEDGPRADTMRNDPWIRIFKFDTKTKKNTAQYAYKLDPVAYPSTPATAFKVNGIPDILVAGNEQFIVLERSFSTGRLPCTIKIFLADIKGATDIKDNASLKITPAKKPISKTLLLNMDSLGVYVDNVEGATFGLTLPNGHRTLVLVADNNFAIFEKTQFFLFEVFP
ncbi:MAG: esterase-like activity of phytase family protein [Bacteroidota bacterium]